MLYKNIDIYCIGYITKKHFVHVKIKSVSPLHLIFNRLDGNIEEWK